MKHNRNPDQSHSYDQELEIIASLQPARNEKLGIGHSTHNARLKKKEKHERHEKDRFNDWD